MNKNRKNAIERKYDDGKCVVQKNIYIYTDTASKHMP